MIKWIPNVKVIRVWFGLDNRSLQCCIATYVLFRFRVDRARAGRGGRWKRVCVLGDRVKTSNAQNGFLGGNYYFVPLWRISSIDIFINYGIKKKSIYSISNLMSIGSSLLNLFVFVTMDLLDSVWNPCPLSNYWYLSYFNPWPGHEFTIFRCSLSLWYPNKLLLFYSYKCFAYNKTSLFPDCLASLMIDDRWWWWWWWIWNLNVLLFSRPLKSINIISKNFS